MVPTGRCQRVARIRARCSALRIAVGIFKSKPAMHISSEPTRSRTRFCDVCDLKDQPGARPLRRLRTWGKTQSIATIDNQSSGYSGNVEAADLFKIAFQMTGSIQDLSCGAADGAAFSICQYNVGADDNDCQEVYA
jgi:hypothetical protein